MSTFGHRLRTLRRQRGQSQNDLAKVIGLSKSSINMYERDEREPSFETMEALADYFNVDLDYLYGRSNIRNRSKYEFEMQKPSSILDKYIENQQFNEESKFDRPEMNSVFQVLFSLGFIARQVFHDKEEHMVSMMSFPSTFRVAFRVPESIFDGKVNDLTEKILEILNYMPEENETDIHVKLNCFLKIANEDAIKKAFSYVSDLLENKKYHQDLGELLPGKKFKTRID